MENLITVIILVLILGGAIRYIIKSRKNGTKCIGCPGGCCPSQKDGNSCNGGCSENQN